MPKAGHFHIRGSMASSSQGQHFAIRLNKPDHSRARTCRQIILPQIEERPHCLLQCVKNVWHVNWWVCALIAQSVDKLKHEHVRNTTWRYGLLLVSTMPEKGIMLFFFLPNLS